MNAPQPASGAVAGTDRGPLPTTARLGAVIIVVFLATWNLTTFPPTWFDEGIHLHVPKALVRFGTYADYSSDGFRYYGPVNSVGPTVMLPIAGAFRVAGVGLLQARVVMVAYLLAAIAAFYGLARTLGSDRFAAVATVLLVTSPAMGLIEMGRQVLGEVPALCFLFAGLAVWFSGWERSRARRLVTVGVLLGLSAVTKPQTVLVLAPGVAAAWLANRVYYRAVPSRTFVVPAFVAALCFVFWQVTLAVYVGRVAVGENTGLLRASLAAAALVLSPQVMARTLRDLLGPTAYFGALLPALLYGAVVAGSGRRDGLKWGLLFAMVAVNLLWYVIGSVGWPRYAILGLSLSALFVARFFEALTDGLHEPSRAARLVAAEAGAASARESIRLASWGWLAVCVVVPLAWTVGSVVRPRIDTATAMAAYLNEHVRRDAVIETWEPEMAFLTDHVFHSPPPALLADAIAYAQGRGVGPWTKYDFSQADAADYLLVGPFAGSFGMYLGFLQRTHPTLVERVGRYELWALKGGSAGAPRSN